MAKDIDGHIIDRTETLYVCSEYRVFLLTGQTRGAGFRRAAWQRRRERSPRGRLLVFGQSLRSRDEKQQGCAGHQVEPGASL